MRRLVSALLLLTLALAGCAAQSEPEPDEAWEPYEQEQPPEPEEPAEPDYPEAFSLAYYKDLTLDPITCAEGVQQEVASLLFEPLFRLDGGFEPEPCLCESYEWDESGRVCTLTLRQDAAFQDGAALHARDVVATLQRAAASERYGYRLRNMASVSASRSGQVVITLARADRGFTALLDIPIVKSGTEDRPVPTGTGPYLLVTGGEEPCLLANGEWWQGKRLPVERIPLVHAKNRDTAMYLFSSRRVELLTVDPTDDLTAVTGQYVTTYQPTAVLQFLGFNTRRGLFADAAARSAFSRGIPRETMAEVQLAGLAQAAQFPMSPLWTLYPADLEAPYDRDETAAALTALAAGWEEEDRELVLLVSEEDSFRLTSARFIAESLSAGGWRVTIRALPWEEYLLALEAGEFDLYFGEVRLTANWDRRDLIGSGGALNYGGYADEYTDLLLEGFAAGLDRRANTRELCQRLLEQAPIAPLCFKRYTVLTHPDVVEGQRAAPGCSFYRLEEWTIHLAGE